MGGTGKTMLANVIFNRISSGFDGYRFLADVRESLSTGMGGVERLQKKLLKDTFGKSDGEIGGDGMNEIQRRLRNRKVLIVFDDVSESSQLKRLVGNFDFFGLGTRIVVATTDRSVCEGLMRSSDMAYEMEGMSDDHALQLFSRHALGGKESPDDFVDLLKRVIRKTGNLSLALGLIGGHLFQKEKRVWEDTIKKLERVPRKDVLIKLWISYDDLEERDSLVVLRSLGWNYRQFNERHGINSLSLVSISRG
ncbi:hypothetical protein MLD38_037767 [Melastoma candidum]|uniref:Uncharacterized protein n=1 Tax=Melastoma candidum TaxID=119954 RepID=A0ACB9LNA2_9MYRT|nr:hypothetical protein MLD38_037767 [Melastoma candidum]